MRLHSSSSPIGPGSGLAAPAHARTWTPALSAATMWLEGAPLVGSGNLTLAAGSNPTHIDAAVWPQTGKTMGVSGNSFGAKPRLSEDPTQYRNGIRPIWLEEKGTRLYSTTGAPGANQPHYMIGAVQFLALDAGTAGIGSFMQVGGQDTASSAMGHDYTAGPPATAAYWIAGQGPANTTVASPLVDLTVPVIMELLYTGTNRYFFLNGAAVNGPTGQPLAMSFTPGNSHLMLGTWWDQYFPPETLIYGCGWDMSGVSISPLAGSARANYVQYLQRLIGLDLPRSLACYGDSITYAFQLADPTTFYGYQARLLYAAAATPIAYETRQEGGSGYTSSQILAALTNVATSNVYRLYKSAGNSLQTAMFQAGTNDALQLPSDSSPATITAAYNLLVSNYIALIAWANGAGYQRIGLASIIVGNADATNPATASLKAQANAWIIANAGTYGYTYVDWSVVTLADLSDGIHPALVGHQKMGAAIKAAFVT